VRGRLDFALVCVALLSSARAGAAESSAFTLETGSPDALCPALEVTREAVARRLGSLVVEGHKGWRARYTIGHAPVGTPRDFVRLELFSPEGTVELVRDLPIEGDSCRTMAEVIALVLDRYFRGLGADGQRPSDGPQTSVTRRPPSPSPAAPPGAPLVNAKAARRLSLEYAVTHPDAQPWLGLRGSTTLGASLELGLALRASLTPLQERAAGGASVEARAVAARSSLAWRLTLGPALLHLGPTLSLAIEQATTRGLATRNDRTRVLWGGGLEAGFVAPLTPSLFVQTTISADVRVTSGHFFIEQREVLAPRWLTLGSSLSAGYSW
jgi:hypothetical protein